MVENMSLADQAVQALAMVKAMDEGLDMDAPENNTIEVSPLDVSLRIDAAITELEAQNARLRQELEKDKEQTTNLVRVLNEMNGPSHMGEPVYPYRQSVLDALHKEIDELEAQNAALLVAIEAKDAALDSLVSWVDDWAETSDTDFPRLEAQVNAARVLSPSTELLEARDRKRDAKLICSIGFPTALRKMWAGSEVLRFLNDKAEARLDGSWKPELGD